MAITENNVVYVYRDGDSDSLALAQDYRDRHSMSSDQLVAVPCSTQEILANYTEFQTEVENTLKSSLATITGSAIGIDVLAIVLGFNVPGGFYDGSDVISSTSRVARINFDYLKKEKNCLFDRRNFSRFDSLDATTAYIVSRIDGPTKSFVEDWMNNSFNIYGNPKISGVFFFDPYSDRAGPLADAYFDDLMEFRDNILFTLGLEVFETSFVDSYIDPTVPKLEKDSFFWGWFTDRGDSGFFESTSTPRVFFYNADFDGAFTMRSSTTKRWPKLALENEYALTAGAMSSPGYDGLLRPFPYFLALLKGSSNAEAYTFSVPYFNWTMTMFGDPLL
jgi:uncharacterized protein (TIGR03790 family)